MKYMGYKNRYKAFAGGTFVDGTIILGMILLYASPSFAQSNLIQNPGFEKGLSGWDQVEPAILADSFRTGSKSLNVTGQDAMASQTIKVRPNTDYIFASYIKNYGRVGVIINGKKNEKRIHGAEDWTKAEIEFNSGSATTIEVYANYYREQGSYDDFILAPKNSVAQSTSTLLTQCPNMGFLPIKSASDDGSNDGNSPSNVIDGNLNNRWSAKGVGKTITFDLSRIADVSQLDVMWYKGNERISMFSIETSIDGRNWSMVLPDSTSTLKDGFDSYDIENILNPEAKLIRIVGAGNSASEWNSISEVKIKGCVN